MVKLVIKKDDEVVVSLRFPSQEEAKKYKDYVENSELYGKVSFSERTEVVPAVVELQEVEIQPEERDEDGNIIQERITEMREIVVEPEKTIVVPPSHTYEIIDMSEERLRLEQLNRRRTLRTIGENLIDEISLKNTEMGLTIEQLKTIMLDQDFVLVRELLWTGSLETAKAIIIEKQEKFVAALGEDYYNWVLNKIEENLT